MLLRIWVTGGLVVFVVVMRMGLKSTYNGDALVGMNSKGSQLRWVVSLLKGKRGHAVLVCLPS